MKSFFSQNKKKIITTSLLIFFVAFLFFIPSAALADNGVAKVLGWIMFPFIWLMGKLAIVLLGILISVAQYSNFIHSSAVTYGWVVVRDLCNMFFVLILLIIAFASILRVDSYNLKTWLPKLVIMAVLINFSKLICGVFIDFAQVIMLTFVNAFKTIAGGNLTEMMGLTKILSFDQAGADDVTGWSIVGSMILALIFSVIAVVVILSMLAMLAMRIVLLWIYIVLSPLAYLTAAFPQGQATSQRWWSDFSKNVIVGPVLAFFIWLAFVSLGGIKGQEQMEDFNLDKEKTSIETGEGSTSGANGASQAALTEAGSSENMLKMIISVGMLLGGLMMAQEMGGRAGAMAGKGMAKLQTMGAGTLKFGKRIGTSAAKRTAEAGLKTAGTLTGGKDTSVGRFLKTWSSDMGTTRKKKAVKNRQEAMESMGMGEKSGAAGKELTGYIKTGLNIGDKKGNKKIKEGSDKIKTGSEDLKLAGSLESSQNKYSSLEAKVSGMSDTNPSKANEEIELQAEARNLETLKVSAGLNMYADDATTTAKINSLKTNGQSEVDAGNTLVEDGNKIKDRKWGKFGTFLVGHTNKAFGKMSEDYEKADNFTENLANDNPTFSEVESEKFSKLDGGINTQQKAVWDNLNTDKHAGASTKLNKLVGDTLFDAAGNPKSLNDSSKGKMNSIARGLKTYGGSGAKLSPDLVALKKMLNDFSVKSGGAIKSVDERKVGAYRISESDSPKNNMDVNESGIGSINEFGRDRGVDDTISYNFDKLKSKGIDMEESASGVYLNDENKAKASIEIVSDIDKELDAIKSKKLSIDLSTSQDSYKKLEGELSNIKPDDPRRAEVEGNLQTESSKLKGFKNQAGLSENSNDQEVSNRVGELDKEYQEKKKFVGNKYDNMSSTGLDNRAKNLEGAKNRLVEGGDFTLKNANLATGLSETVITKRHEGIHKELDNTRKNNNFEPTKEQVDEEEVLAEYYGKKAREVQVTHKVVDQVVADVIFDGQKKGLTTDEIKLEIDKVTREYQSGRNPSESVPKEKLNQNIQTGDQNIQTGNQNVQVDNIINNEKNNSSDSFSGIVADLNNLGDGIEDNFSKIGKSVSNVDGSVRDVKKSLYSDRVEKGIEGRLNLYRYNQLKKNKK